MANLLVGFLAYLKSRKRANFFAPCKNFLKSPKAGKYQDPPQKFPGGKLDFGGGQRLRFFCFRKMKPDKRKEVFQNENFSF